MKDPKEYIIENEALIWMPEAGEVYLESDIIRYIKLAQKDSYNQALLDVENITPEGWISIVEVKKLKIK